MTGPATPPDSPDAPSPGPLKTLVINASVAFVAAHLIVVLLHELAHVAAGLSLGYVNVLYPFGVTHAPDPTRGNEVIMLLAGPVFSLVTGLVAVMIQPFRRARGFAHLLWLWVAYMSVMEGIGYLLLTPVGVGDTGAAAALVGSPVLVVWPCFLVAIAGTLLLAKHFALPAVRHTTADLTSLRGFTFFPWIAGTVAVLVLTLIDLLLAAASFSGGEIVAVLMGSFAIGVFAPMAMPFTTGHRKKSPDVVGSEPLALPQVPIAGVVIIVVIVLFNFLVLSRGLSIG